jgi:hypothetical protein
MATLELLLCDCVFCDYFADEPCKSCNEACLDCQEQFDEENK